MDKIGRNNDETTTQQNVFLNQKYHTEILSTHFFLYLDFHPVSAMYSGQLDSSPV